MKSKINSPKAITLSIGILFAPAITFRLNGTYWNKDQKYSGEYTISKEGKNLILHSSSGTQIVPDHFTLTPENAETTNFDLLNVMIGINFHWQRTEDQKFKGTLKIIDEGKHLTAINILPLEDYLLSVISSEMSATSSLELLKAHAVISRSWLIAQKIKSEKLTDAYHSCIQDEQQYIRWYDREDHEHFDVCADDHCQRYQGISKAYMPFVRQAIEATRGEVLVYDGEICDARFSKWLIAIPSLQLPTYPKKRTPENGFSPSRMYSVIPGTKPFCQMFSTIMIKKPKTFSVGKCLTLPLNYLH